MPNLDTYTFSAPDVIKDPYPYFALLRAEDPVHFDKQIKTWLVTRYDDILAAARDHETFSDEIRVSDEVLPPFHGDVEEYLQSKGVKFDSSDTLKVDGPIHRQRRAMLAPAFSPATIATLTDRITAICRNKLEGFLDHDEVDLVKEYATRIPLEAIADTLGLPTDRLDDIKRGADSLVGHSFGSAKTREEGFQFADNLITLMKFSQEVIDERRKNPGADLISHLVHPPEGDDSGLRLSDLELLTTVAVSIAGGVDTTASGLTFALLALATKPELLQRLRHSGEQEKDISRFCEEVLRFYTPVPALPRVVNKDAVFRGKEMSEGDIVFLCWASANRDPEMFDDPDTFDIDRKNATRHMTFGTGAHNCLGSHLARNEIKCAIREFVKRVESMELLVPEEELDYSESIMFLRAPKSLPVKLKYV